MRLLTTYRPSLLDRLEAAIHDLATRLAALWGGPGTRLDRRLDDLRRHAW
jgi:hypothetical protein